MWFLQNNIKAVCIKSLLEIDDRQFIFIHKLNYYSTRSRRGEKITELYLPVQFELYGLSRKERMDGVMGIYRDQTTSGLS